LATGFRNVDAGEVEKMASCLDFIQGLDCFRRYKERSIDLLAVDHASTCLDLACGLGDDVGRLSERCGMAIGIDRSTKFIALARHRWRRPNLRFETGDAKALLLADGTVDAARIDRSLQHIDDPGAVIREMARVVRSGGRILCAEPDWGTFFIGSGQDPLTLCVQSAWAGSFRNPWMGRNLLPLMRSAGIAQLKLECHALLTEEFVASDLVFDIAQTAERLSLTEPAARSWLERYRKSEAVAGVTLMICRGVKP
jgi:ubiquinone/menaquinone biosynthesis C-methylase UbiE